MACIIGIETSTEVCSVALNSKENKILLREQKTQNVHGELLTEFIKQLLDENDLHPGDIEAVSVSQGPGSYTGLRIGVSVAKGLCYATGIPLIAVSSLKIIARSVQQNHAGQLSDKFLICPMIDARRMEVFTCLYDKDLNVTEDTTSKILGADTYNKYLQQYQILFCGNGAEKYKKILSHENAQFHKNVSSAEYLVQLALTEFEKKNFEDLAYFEPFYLKDFIAIPPKNKVIP